MHNNMSTVVCLICQVAFRLFGRSKDLNTFLSHDRDHGLLSTVVPHITDAVQEWVMTQAMVPVDGHKEEPHICVIEASMAFFCINLYPSGFL